MSPKIHRHWVACPYCDALHRRLPLRRGQVLQCDYCHSSIDDGQADFRLCFVYALSALIFFVVAHVFPFMTLDLMGERHTVSISSSVAVLFERQFYVLALLVALFIIIVPLWYLLAMLWAIISFRFHFLNEWVRHFLHWMHHLSTWNMLEVYLVGVLVTLVKLMQMAHIQFEIAFWAFLALILCSVLATSSFDLKDAIFGINRDDDEPQRP